MKEKALVIVESPSKAKTIGKILGSRYKVVASVGHVRDLPKSKLGINIEENFEPNYISIRGKGDVIKMLKKEAKAASKVYLATDPDREGEAISWHIAYLLGIDASTPCRIEFNEITKTAVKNAVKHPRPINLDLVDAQQARRVLDRLVGYQISPLLWRKIRRGLSAGRVQSAALKILCDREKEIQAFVPEEYWSVDAVFEKGRKKFKAELVKYNGKKIRPSSAAQTDDIISVLDGGKYTVARVEEKERIKKPMPPFTTSSLQQEASNKLNYNTKRTMMIAQQLYEGVDVKGRGTVGLVTYIRTDSVRISDEAKETAKNMIISDYGDQYLGTNVYANKKKDVQDAHEAIRPSDPTLKPDMVKDSLTKDNYRLYKLIYERFLASQMSEALYSNVNVSFNVEDYIFKAVGKTLEFAGYTAVYKEYVDEEKQEISKLPKLQENSTVKVTEIKDEQKFTKPPARYSEASLVKAMEEKGIGRPATYAATITILTARNYCTKEGKYLVPTELGRKITEYLDKFFHGVINVKFTAYMEGRLDDIAENKDDWHEVVENFWNGFKGLLEKADASSVTMKSQPVETDIVCEKCGHKMVVREGKYGKFLGCSNFPKCKNVKPMEGEEKKAVGVCPECGKSVYPFKTKHGKTFYACEDRHGCNFMSWDIPTGKKCPECGKYLIRRGKKIKCSACQYQEEMPQEQPNS